MNWTKYKPEKAGYYFYKGPKTWGMVEVDHELNCWIPASPEEQRFDQATEWFGPLEPSEMDYRELLKRYMRAIEIKMGTTFVRGDPHPRGESLEELDLTKEDIAELEKIQLLLDYKVH